MCDSTIWNICNHFVTEITYIYILVYWEILHKSAAQAALPCGALGYVPTASPPYRGSLHLRLTLSPQKVVSATQSLSLLDQTTQEEHVRDGAPHRGGAGPPRRSIAPDHRVGEAPDHRAGKLPERRIGVPHRQRREEARRMGALPRRRR
jgi:hypothetical protein